MEQPPLGAVDALGIVGEDGLQGVGYAPVGGAQGRRRGRLAGICGSLAAVVMDDSGGVTKGGDFGGQKLRDKADYRAANGALVAALLE